MASATAPALAPAPAPPGPAAPAAGPPSPPSPSPPPSQPAPSALVAPSKGRPPVLAAPLAIGVPPVGPSVGIPPFASGLPAVWTVGAPAFVSALYSSWAGQQQANQPTAGGFVTIHPSSSAPAPTSAGATYAGATGTTASLPAASQPTGTLQMSPSPTSSPSGSGGMSAGGGDSGSGDGNRTLVITLSTILSVVGFLLIVGAIFICLRYRQGRFPFFPRGSSPIDDDEIATWKISRASEKQAEADRGRAAPPAPLALGAGVGVAAASAGGPRYTTAPRKPPSLIVYQSHSPGRLSEDGSPSPPLQNYTSYGGGAASYYRPSLDLPQTPVLAKAPNSRAGLTDETVPGDAPYVTPPPPRRPTSRRLSKMPPSQHHHTRTRSSRSSTSVRSYGGGATVGAADHHAAWYQHGNHTDVELSPRASTDFNSPSSHSFVHHSHHGHHHRVYSSSSIPPRLSLGDDFLGGGLSPRPLLRDEIGRAIG